MTLPNNVPVNFDDNVELEPEFGHLPDTQKLVGCLLEAAAAAATCSNDEDNKDDYEDEDEDDDDKVHDITYFSASKWLEKNTPPVIRVCGFANVLTKQTYRGYIPSPSQYAY